MTDLDGPAFVEALTVLALSYRQSLTQHEQAAYFITLRDISLVDVLDAMGRAHRMGDARWMPTAASIRQYTASPEQCTAGEAYEALVDVLRRSALGMPADAPEFVHLLVTHLGGAHEVLRLPSGLMRRLVEQRLPDVLRVAAMRGIPLPSRITSRGEVRQLTQRDGLDLAKVG